MLLLLLLLLVLLLMLLGQWLRLDSSADVVAVVVVVVVVELTSARSLSLAQFAHASSASTCVQLGSAALLAFELGLRAAIRATVQTAQTSVRVVLGRAHAVVVVVVVVVGSSSNLIVVGSVLGVVVVVVIVVVVVLVARVEAVLAHAQIARPVLVLHGVGVRAVHQRHVVEVVAGAARPVRALAYGRYRCRVEVDEAATAAAAAAAVARRWQVDARSAVETSEVRHYNLLLLLLLLLLLVL